MELMNSARRSAVSVAATAERCVQNGPWTLNRERRKGSMVWCAGGWAASKSEGSGRTELWESGPGG